MTSTIAFLIAVATHFKYSTVDDYRSGVAYVGGIAFGMAKAPGEPFGKPSIGED